MAYLALPASGSSAVCFTVRSITSRVFRALSASERIYPHCCKYTRDTPYLHLSTVCQPKETLAQRTTDSLADVELEARQDLLWSDMLWIRRRRGFACG
jgi:hypothetical protein